MASRKAKRANTLGEATEPAFDRITQLATVALRVPGAAVALSDARGLFVMSAYGLPGCDERERLLEFSFCAHVVTNGAPLVVNDARADSPEQADPSPLRPIVSFAGVPIVASSGQVIGVLCVFEHRPRAWTPDAVTALTALAHAAITEIELRSMLQTIHDSSEEIRRSYIRRR
jgi:GAF domain-containing protein